MADNNGNTQNAVEGTLFLTEREVKVEDKLVFAVGPTLCTYLNRILKVVTLFNADHSQVNVAANDFVTWLLPQFDRFNEDKFSLQITDKNFFLNGQLLKFDQRTFLRNSVFREKFMSWSINQITFHRAIGAGEIVAMGHAIHQASKSQTFSLELFRQPHLSLESVIEKELNLPETDDKRQMIELYAGLVVKTSIFFDRIKKGPISSARFLKRIVQKISDELDEHAFLFVGLINLRLIEGQDFIHATNTCIYAMLLAHACGLDRQDIVRCGMTALTQNIERLRKQTKERQFAVGDESHYSNNINSVVTLSELGANDILSALRLVTSYERGFPYDRPLPKKWYQEEMRPHVLSRIIEISRHYDVFTSGMQGADSVDADRALQKMMSNMGGHYDPQLFKIFVNVVGIFPVGSIISLSSGDQAIVIRSPLLVTNVGLSSANRPTVKMLDGSERIVDLAQSQHRGLRIIGMVPKGEIKEQPGALFLF